MNEIELSAATIEYEDTGGAGPAVVLLHGLLMDASLWAEPISELAVDHRCVAPTLPMGGHRQAMPAEAVGHEQRGPAPSAPRLTLACTAIGPGPAVCTVSQPS
jgi:pimeloyl-ACP methyl ester carboxylesterase